MAEKKMRFNSEGNPDRENLKAAVLRHPSEGSIQLSPCGYNQVALYHLSAEGVGFSNVDGGDPKTSSARNMFAAKSLQASGQRGDFIISQKVGMMKWKKK